MGIAGAIIGAGALSAVGGVVASSMASGAQQDAANTAANTQLSMYNQTRGDLLPYNTGGQSAFQNLISLLGGNGGGGVPQTGAMMSALQNYPGYQFTQQQGQQALDRSEAAKGQLLSGGQLKDTAAYNQGLASQLFQQYFGNNYQLASLGENAGAQTGNYGAQAASGAANAQMAGGAAAASGIVGANNAIQGGLNSALQGYALNNAMNQNWLNNAGVNVTPINSAFSGTGAFDMSGIP